MSLVSALMEGRAYGIAPASINRAKYGHDGGSLAIAMESEAELYDIFVESFYKPEQYELAALREGVALESSSYAYLAENAFTNALTKIKEFFKKLWAKVKEFFGNVKKYLDSVFMDGAKFVSKYKAELKKKDLTGFRVQMFKYKTESIIDLKLSTDQIDAEYDTAEKVITKFKTAKVASGDQSDNTKVEAAAKAKQDEFLEEFQKELDDKLLATAKKLPGCGDITEATADEVSQAVYAELRNGASSPNEQQYENVDIDKIIDTLDSLEKSTTSIDTIGTKVDGRFTKAIKTVDKVETDTKRDTSLGTIAASALGKYSSFLGAWQTLENKVVQEWKKAASELVGAYQRICKEALRYKPKK